MPPFVVQLPLGQLRCSSGSGLKADMLNQCVQCPLMTHSRHFGFADVDSPMEGSATLTEDQSIALTGGKMYINVHTAKYPDGEIRGQLAPAK